MLRWFLFAAALGGFALGLLAWVRTPDWLSWKLSLLAGEFGHWLAIATLAAGLAGWGWRGEHGILGGVALTLGLAGALLLLGPVWLAGRIAAGLPATLRAQFPHGRSEARPFALPALFVGRDPPPVAFRTLPVPDGLPLDFYPASGVRGGSPAPCVVVIHGGGWDGGDRTQLPGLNHWLARQGYAVAAISYRLAPTFTWPAQREDVFAALAFLKSRADELGLDPTRFVLLGRSAGGQIALVSGYVAGDPAIRGVVGLYAPSDLIFGYVNTHENDMLRSPALMRQFLGGTPDTARANYESASALQHVGPRTPPTLLLHGTNDALVWYRHSERLDARLAEFGVPRAFVHLPWATHAFEYNLHGPGGQLTTYALEWFLADVTR
ncbi:MAG: alpha/beta hydrolase [Opitutaceae bacterium]|nr:alpha/beta hydrolase [Opitutaceae bacterium]